MDVDNILDGIPEDEVEIIKSNKGGLKVIHKGYMYTVHKKRQCGGIRWRCAQRSLHCKGSISTGRDGPPKINMPHNHLPDLHSVALARGRQADDLMAFTQQIMDVKLEVEQPDDSMPLQERLVRNPLPLDRIGLGPAQAGSSGSGAAALKSQSLSPTKLKVTRQSYPQQQHQQQRTGAGGAPSSAQAPPVKESQNEEMCLRWNSHHSNMQTAFPSILIKEQYVDVTLAAEGKTLKCHRLILSSCSPYFEEILSGISPMQHPVLFMKDIPFWILKSLCDFMYAGEVHIYQNKLEELLTVAEALKIKGLAGKSSTPAEKKKDDSAPRHNDAPQQRPPQQSATREEVQRRRVQQYQQQQQQIHHQQQQQRNSSNYQHMFDSTQDDDDDILDPLELLAPMYEEATEDKKPTIINTTTTATTTSSTGSLTITPHPAVIRPKEIVTQQQQQQQQQQRTYHMISKKTFPMKKLRKRKLSEAREPSPPPVFTFRKGTRSRPNVKIPKYYSSDYGNTSKNSTGGGSGGHQSANQSSDPLIDEDEIKTEPIDVEDNMVEYGVDDDHDHNYHELLPTMVPEIRMKIQPADDDVETSPKFKRIRLVKPVISEVHSVKDAEAIGGLEVIPITLNHKEPEPEETPPPAPDPEDPATEMDVTENSVAEEQEPKANSTGKDDDETKDDETGGKELEDQTGGKELEHETHTELEIDKEQAEEEEEEEEAEEEAEDIERQEPSSKELQQNEELGGGDKEVEDKEPDAITNDSGD